MRLPARMHVHKLERDLLLVEARENPRHIREERPRAVDINRGGSHGLRVRKTHKLEALSPSSGSLCSLMVERFLPLLQAKLLGLGIAITDKVKKKKETVY